MMESAGSDPQPIGVLWLLDLGEQPADSAPVTPRIPASLGEVGAGDAALLADAMGLHDSAPVLERFAGGARCYAAWVSGALASYCWISFRDEWISELALHIRLDEGEAYIWDCATLPAYRGQGLYPALLSLSCGELRAEGMRRIWIGADAGNTDSHKGIIRAGFRTIADFYVSPAGAPERFYVIGRPGVSEDLVQAAHDALLSGEGNVRSSSYPSGG